MLTQSLYGRKQIPQLRLYLVVFVTSNEVTTIPDDQRLITIFDAIVLDGICRNLVDFLTEILQATEE
jgi:hypothetical protein